MQNTTAAALDKLSDAVTQGVNQERQLQIESEPQTGIASHRFKPVVHLKVGFRHAGKAQFKQWRVMSHLESCLAAITAVRAHLPANNTDSHGTAGQFLQLANFR